MKGNKLYFKVTFNPQDNNQICVTGQCVFKLFRYLENNLKQFGNQKSDTSCNYICQAWLNQERLLVGTESGKILLFDNGELKGEFVVLNAATPSASSKTNLG